MELDLHGQVLFSFQRISVNFLNIHDKMGVSQKRLIVSNFE